MNPNFNLFTGSAKVHLGGNESRDVELYAFHEEAKYLLALPLC